MCLESRAALWIITFDIDRLTRNATFVQASSNYTHIRPPINSTIINYHQTPASSASAALLYYTIVVSCLVVIYWAVQQMLTRVENRWNITIIRIMFLLRPPVNTRYLSVLEKLNKFDSVPRYIIDKSVIAVVMWFLHHLNFAHFQALQVWDELCPIFF